MKDENGKTPDEDREAVEIPRGCRDIERQQESRDSRNRETVTTEYS